jgi:limonene-1,2-epoxide hydrolase
MKQFLFILLFFVTVSSCTSSTKEQTNASVAVVEKYKAAIQSKNYAAMDSLLADNYMGYGPSTIDSTNKAGALENWKNNAENLYESIEFSQVQNLPVVIEENTEGMAAGNWVSSWSLATIKYKDGRGPVQLWVNVEYKIENGKIVYTRTFYDEADVLRQLNYSIEPAAAE